MNKMLAPGHYKQYVKPLGSGSMDRMNNIKGKKKGYAHLILYYKNGYKFCFIFMLYELKKVTQFLVSNNNRRKLRGSLN